MSLETKFTEIVGCELPIQNAGMGTQAPALAYAVAQAGGLGTLSGVGPAPDQLHDMVAGSAVPKDRPLAINFLMPFLEDTALIDAVADKVRVVEFFYGEPNAEFVKHVHAGGALALWQTGSLLEAQQAVDCGCDLIAVQGIEAGGHVRGTRGLFSLLAEIREMINIPIIAAGGIATPRAVAMALNCGAHAVRVGTRFAATFESGYHADYIQALVDAGSDDTEYTERFSVMWEDAPQRVLKSCIAAADNTRDEIVARIKFGESTVDVPRFSFFAPTVDTEGNVAAMAQYAGQGVGAISECLPAGEVVSYLMDGARQLLKDGLQ